MPNNSYIFENDIDTVALWRMNGDATDETGNHNGTLIGAPASVDGIAGSAYSFTGSQGIYPLANQSGLTFGSSDFAIEAWFYIDPSPSAQQIVVQKSSTTTWDYTIQYNSGNIRIGFGVGLGDLRAVNTAAPAGYWYYSVITRDTNTCYIYINGEEVGTIDVTGVSMANIAGAAIGQYGSSGLSRWKGYIDEIRMSNALRSATEVKENWYRGINNKLLYGASV